MYQQPQIIWYSNKASKLLFLFSLSVFIILYDVISLNWICLSMERWEFFTTKQRESFSILLD